MYVFVCICTCVYMCMCVYVYVCICKTTSAGLIEEKDDIAQLLCILQGNDEGTYEWYLIT